MEWNYKGVKIEISFNGNFYFSFAGKSYRSDSLEKAKSVVDNLTKDYYTFSEKDYKALLAKLTPREQHLIKNLVEAYKCHLGNAYCELGDTLEEFNVTFIG